MLKNPASRYLPFPAVDLPDRQWPSRQLSQAPVWLSTDLRDGNQALFEPMNRERKLRLFHELVRIGFKEIEVGFPSASQTDYAIVRHLIDEGLIPADVTPMVITQLREDLIRATVDSVAGARRAIVHFYNAVAPAWREIVFGMQVPEIIAMVERHIALLRELTDAHPETEWVLQYSPETFCMAELEVSLAVCNAAIRAWDAGPARPMIINLPTTVEVSTANVFADQIEWMHRRLERREHIVLSVHPHNDRGTGVACAEQALLAGAQRVEGCLFGNGERTGNLDVVNVALNMYIQGVSPGLDFSDIDGIRSTVEHCNQLPVHPRHPYVGDLVYTSFSGSHQDAIKKAFADRKDGDIWDMPYLPIDPKDLGRSYEAVIRVNSQSGKGGIAYLLESEYGLQLPRRLQIEFSQVVQREMDASGKELAAADLWALFQREYGLQSVQAPHYRLSENDGVVSLSADLSVDGGKRTVEAQGTGPIDAFVQALSEHSGRAVRVLDYNEHAIGEGANAKAIAYVELRVDELHVCYGVGVDANIVSASFRAIMSGLQRVPSAEKVTVQEAVAA